MRTTWAGALAYR